MNDSKTFDPSKPVRTSDGRKARILCTDLESTEGDDYQGVCAVEYENQKAGYSVLRFNPETGEVPSCSFRLENTPEHRFFNVYRSSASGAIHGSLKGAIEIAKITTPSLGWLGTVEETENGEFVAFHPKTPSE